MIVEASSRRLSLPNLYESSRNAAEPALPFTLPTIAETTEPTQVEKTLARICRILDLQTLLQEGGEAAIGDDEILIATNAIDSAADADKNARWLEYCESAIPGLNFGFSFYTEDGTDPRDELIKWTYVNPNKLPPSAVERLLALASSQEDAYDPPVVAAYRHFLSGRLDEQGRLETGGGEPCGFWVKDPASLGIELSLSVSTALSVASQLMANWDLQQTKNSLHDGLFDLFGDLQGQTGQPAEMPLENSGGSDAVSPL